MSTKNNYYSTELFLNIPTFLCVVRRNKMAASVRMERKVDASQGRRRRWIFLRIPMMRRKHVRMTMIKTTTRRE